MTDCLGALIIDIEGSELSAFERELISHPLIGGIILFSRNYESRKQLKELTLAIRCSRKTPLLVMVDQEGGRVQRFKNEFTTLPSLSFFGRLYDSAPSKVCELTKNCGWLMASELLSFQIDLSFAPVLDLRKGMSSVIGDRAFHSDPNVVTTLAKCMMMGMKEAGMEATGKHFPGHGSVALDSHRALPIDDRSFEAIDQSDLVPFKEMVAAGMKSMMAAHIIFSKVDKQPVSYSSVWLKEILRKRLGFNGVIFSDDLNMEGANISHHYADRVIAVREAGCDFALLCNNRKGVIEAIDQIPAASHMVPFSKWNSLRGNFSNQTELLEKSKRWQETHDFLMNIEVLNNASGQ